MSPRKSSPAKKSSSRKRPLLAGAYILPMLALGACADYLNHEDTVTSSAGNAVAHNIVVHTADPWPPAAANTRITGNGQRVDVVTKKYLAGPTATTTTSSSSSSPTPNDKPSGNPPSQ